MPQGASLVEVPWGAAAWGQVAAVHLPLTLLTFIITISATKIAAPGVESDGERGRGDRAITCHLVACHLPRTLLPVSRHVLRFRCVGKYGCGGGLWGGRGEGVGEREVKTEETWMSHGS